MQGRSPSDFDALQSNEGAAEHGKMSAVLVSIGNSRLHIAGSCSWTPVVPEGCSSLPSAAAPGGRLGSAARMKCYFPASVQRLQQQLL